VWWILKRKRGCVNNVLLFPFKTTKQLKKEVIGRPNVSVRTTQKVCQKKLPLPSPCAAKRLLLTVKMLSKEFPSAKNIGRGW
jgi:hypothetical protein